MRRIGIEEPTAIRPEVLYRLKRRDRTQRNGLVGAQSGVRHDVGGKRLRLALLGNCGPPTLARQNDTGSSTRVVNRIKSR